MLPRLREEREEKRGNQWDSMTLKLMHFNSAGFHGQDTGMKKIAGLIEVDIGIADPIQVQGTGAWEGPH